MAHNHEHCEPGALLIDLLVRHGEGDQLEIELGVGMDHEEAADFLIKLAGQIRSGLLANAKPKKHR